MTDPTTPTPYDGDEPSSSVAPSEDAVAVLSAGPFTALCVAAALMAGGSEPSSGRRRRG